DKGALEAYAYKDGEPIRLFTFEKKSELVEGTHYSGSCTLKTTRDVLLRDATVFAKEDLSGQGCRLTVGTEVEENKAGIMGGGLGRLSAPEVKTACGFDVGFSRDLAVAP